MKCKECEFSIKYRENEAQYCPIKDKYMKGEDSCGEE
jgi:hypothetical protein